MSSTFAIRWQVFVINDMQLFVTKVVITDDKQSADINLVACVGGEDAYVHKLYHHMCLTESIPAYKQQYQSRSQSHCAVSTLQRISSTHKCGMLMHLVTHVSLFVSVCLLSSFSDF